ncbi:MAG TPA: phosphatase domain-containing protein [Kineosporiaceae bacterium]|nr:phosphatase domain-containing protein [Kineosporiaceae bacterium]
MPATAAQGPARAAGSASPHWAARIEDAAHAVVVRVLRRRGWQPRVLPYTGYGGAGWARVLGRVLLCPPGTGVRELERSRGWRRFLSAAVSGVEVDVVIGSCRTTVTSERGGYLDAVLASDLPPGWGQARLSTGAVTSRAPLCVVGQQAGLGVVSDIDDTVMVTAIPRPLLAFWNTFVRHESSRRPVPGMAQLYRRIIAEEPDGFVVYLSTGAWNVAPALAAFLARHDFPPGPLLMTDWGPTPHAWFRSGREHKRTQLRRLMAELPHLRWLLVGDDGQHDPQLYQEAAAAAPGRVRAVAIRQLTPSQQVLAHGTLDPLPDGSTGPQPSYTGVPEVRAPDGNGLLSALSRTGALDSPHHPAPGGGHSDE